MSSTNPLVSIIIPCYNAEEYVMEAIESALNQTYNPTEIIVIDDGSTDSSLDVIQSFGESIMWRTEENMGVSAARNRGLEIASGKFVKFLDSDDILVNSAISIQVEQMSGLSSSRDIVFGDAKRVDKKGRVQKKTQFRPIKEGEDPIEYILNINPQTSLPLHRYGLLRKVGGFDEQLRWAEEYDLHLRLHLEGAILRYRPSVISLIRHHDSDDRLTNQKANEYKHDPEAPLQRCRKRVRTVRQKDSEGLSENVRQIMAWRTWTEGRKALRHGYPHIASKYFEFARDLHPNCLAEASRAYRWCTSIFGPLISERIGILKRKISRLVKK